MSGKNKKMSSKTEERYCHAIGANTAVNRVLSGGEIRYECINSSKCQNKGNCENSRFCNCNK